MMKVGDFPSKESIAINKNRILPLFSWKLQSKIAIG
jgi:hypothetical protein